MQGKKLAYFVAGERSVNGTLQIVDLHDSDLETGTNSVAIPIDRNAGDKAKRWSMISQQHAAVLGNDWFFVANLDGENTERIFEFSLNNKAQRIELANKNLLVHHQDLSVTQVAVNPASGEPNKIRRMTGFHQYVSMSPDGLSTAFVPGNGDKTFVSVSGNIDKADLIDKAKSIPVKAIALTWLSKSAISNLKLPNAGQLDYALATISRSGKGLKLDIWNADGTQIELPNGLQNLRLRKDRMATVESFTISNVTGELLSIIWNVDQEDRADVWKYAKNEKPADGQDLDKIPSSWFALDTSAVGKITSIDFGETLDESIEVDKIAPRIVIGSENQGSKAIKLYALALGLEFKTKPLLDLTVTDKLQQVDQIVGASFSGDGKTLLSMTAERARVRLTDGWRNKKTDVEFDEQISIFNNKLEESNLENLMEQKEKLDKPVVDVKKQELERSLEKAAKNAVEQVAEAQTTLDEAVSNFNDKTREIRKNVQGKEDQAIRDTKAEIKKKKAELEKLKAELGKG